MKLQSVVTAALIAAVSADDAQKPLTGEKPSSSVDLPTFTATSLKGEFIEQFTEDWDKRWKPSHAKKDIKEGEEEWAYIGEWSVEEPSVLKGMEGYKGLVVKNAAAHHAISAKFPKKIDPKGKPLVVQYEVKLQNGLECGGAYMKLLRENKALHQDEFSNTTPYVIMFGPDKCGHTNKVHFIFNHKNPKTGEYEEKHLTSPPTAKITKATELYTLIVHTNNTVIIQQNGDTVKEADLLKDFQPPVNPPAEIYDPEDSKPKDWVDEARIPDPDATKPDDWDEDAPFEIVDEDAVKPDDWLEDESATITDPDAIKPEDWVDEEDGDWIGPTVPNPKCAEASGCGPWSKPMKRNPDHKGPWSAPMIDNPDYKGPWEARKIPNPDGFNDTTPSNFEPMGAIGFEIWTMQKDIMFSNIYIGHSVEDARKLAEESFFPKKEGEKALEDAEKPDAKDEPKIDSASDLKFLDDPVLYATEKLDLFLTIFKSDPMEAVRFVPEVPAFAAGALVIFISILSMLFGGGSAPAKKASGKKQEKKETEKKATGAATGADTGKTGATKRTAKAT
ncbi:Calnexin-like protein [Ceratocystis lukuohia]|uniref:Calnexin-like protein n=1 Tax=Ceratocystis lukuohia TaxID=2019550 RepID=A0ABR4MM75_9PEZI